MRIFMALSDMNHRGWPNRQTFPVASAAGRAHAPVQSRGVFTPPELIEL
jgi:hypothetical protein